MDTVAGIAQRAGIRADFTIADDDMTYGWESPEGIGLNISGMNYELDKNGKPKRTGQKHHLLVTFGHEMTHWLQRNSMQGYNRLEQYVLKSYINDHSAEELMHLLNNKMNRGEMLSLEDAISEFVANSCDQILGSEQVRDHIAKTDGKLFSQIKGFVKDLVNRFKNAIKGMDASASYEAQQMAGRMNELAKIWLGAYDEALSDLVTNTEATEKDQSENKRNSLVQYTAHEIENWRGSKSIEIYEGHKSFADFYKRALSSNNFNKKMYFGKIGSNLASRIKQAAGIDTEGLNVALYGNEIRKIIKKHGDAKKEAKMGQLPVDVNVMEEIIDVIGNPDSIKPAGMYEGHPAIEFSKDIKGVTTTITYVVPNKHDLKVQTMYKHKNKSLSPSGYAKNAQPPLTSKTTQGTALNKNISQSNKNGKTRSSRYLIPNEKGYWTGMNTVQRIGGEYYVVNNETKEQTRRSWIRSMTKR